MRTAKKGCSCILWHFLRHLLHWKNEWQSIVLNINVKPTPTNAIFEMLLIIFLSILTRDHTHTHINNNGTHTDTPFRCVSNHMDGLLCHFLFITTFSMNTIIFLQLLLYAAFLFKSFSWTLCDCVFISRSVANHSTVAKHAFK